MSSPCLNGLARALLAASIVVASGPDYAAARPGLQVGQVRLRHCETPAPWCARLTRPLDPTGIVPGTLEIYFEFYPHLGSGAAAGTLVAAEGGPGYPTTESREDYLGLFLPLRRTHDVLLMDYRGTGRSGAIDCEPLQRAAVQTTGDIGACGRSLGRHAPFYSSTLAADDLAAVLDALGIDRIDLYGDSFGTYFSQVFALRHADRLRSLVLDGAYALEGPDYAWYPHYAPATRAKFDLACARDAACRAIPGSSIDHMRPALQQLRAAPFEARVPDDAGQVVPLHVDASSLAIVLYGAAPAYATVRETDAAARAFSAGDAAPLLRLMVETLGSIDSRDASQSPEKFSAGMAVAVFCQDPPQAFDMALEPAQRLAALERAYEQVRLETPNRYAPFTLDEYLGMPLDYVYVNECVEWPVAPDGAPAPPRVVPHEPYPQVPVLVISGELDNVTSVADGEAAASHFPLAHHVMIANSFHVNALPRARSDCGMELVRRFISTLATDEESCAAQVPPVPLVAHFARSAQELAPARSLPGNQAPAASLREVTAAVQTCEDVIVRAETNGAGHLVGLRGGSFESQTKGEGYRLKLHAVRWTEDVMVSGHIDWPGRDGTVRAELRLLDAEGRRGQLAIHWRRGEPTEARASGRIEGRLVEAATPAS